MDEVVNLVGHSSAFVADTLVAVVHEQGLVGHARENPAHEVHAEAGGEQGPNARHRGLVRETADKGMLRRADVEPGMQGRLSRFFLSPARCSVGLIPFSAAVQALGRQSISSRRADEVPVQAIVRTLSRSTDFDQHFRLSNRALRPRLPRVTAATAAGMSLPAVELIQLDEMYFVVDGHHRISTAKARGQLVVDASIRKIGTVAFAMACLRSQHLPNKAAERAFLETMPLDSNNQSLTEAAFPTVTVQEAHVELQNSTSPVGQIPPPGKDLRIPNWCQALRIPTGRFLQPGRATCRLRSGSAGQGLFGVAISTSLKRQLATEVLG